MCEPFAAATLPLVHGFTGRSNRVTGLEHRTLSSARQVHGARVVDLSEIAVGEEPQADALIARLSETPERFPVIRTADCVPILIADPATKTVAAVHSGWRGTVQRIVPETIARFMRYGIAPDELRVAIGPAIGVCCYEIGDDVRKALGGSADLKRIVQAQALDSGVLPERIWCSDGCTFCEPARWHSYRRDGREAGRQTAFIGLP